MISGNDPTASDIRVKSYELKKIMAMKIRYDTCFTDSFSN